MKQFILIFTIILFVQKLHGQYDSTIYGQNAKTRKYANINGERIYYEIYGKGFPLVLLHGGLGSISEFKNNISDLAKEFQVIAIDSRGYGRSTNMNDTLSYSVMASDVYNLINYLKLDSVDIVGFSDGGIIGFHLASKYPSKVRKVIASGANYSIEGLKSTWFQDTMMLREKVLHDGFWKRFREAYKSNPNPDKFDIHIQMIRKMWITEPYLSKEYFDKISKPVLLIFGDRDVIKMNHILEMYEQLPEKTRQLCIFPNTSHFTFKERPNEIDRVIIEFLKPSK